MQRRIILPLRLAAAPLALLTLGLAGCAAARAPEERGPAQANGPASPVVSLTRAAPPAHPSQYSVEVVASGLVHPWSVAFMPDGRMLVTERPGRVRIIDRTGQMSQPLEGLPPMRAVASGAPMFPPVGLHDVATDPGFPRNQRLYLSYLAPPARQPAGAIAAEPYRAWILSPAEERERNPIGVPQVASARLSADGRRLEDVAIILTGAHRRLVFAPDGTLFVTSSTPAGRGVPIDDQPQRLSSPQGKVLRINRDGSVPPDNPWARQPGARPEIYAIGLRDPQGAAIHPSTGQLWTVEHGPLGGDEINIVRAGGNYGYPVISYGRQYSGDPIGEGLTAMEGMQQPVYYWTPSIGPSGMAFYTGDLLPQWKGDLFIGALAGRHLVRLVLDGARIVAEERLLEDLGHRIRDVRQGPDGALYVLTDAPDGRLLRIVPKR